MNRPSTHLAADLKEECRLFREFRRGGLCVVESKPVLTPSGLLQATLVKTRARPNVRDLSHLHRPERLARDGDNRTAWAADLDPSGQDSLIRLDVEVKNPVWCAFRLLWDPVRTMTPRWPSRIRGCRGSRPVRRGGAPRGMGSLGSKSSMRTCAGS